MNTPNDQRILHAARYAFRHYVAFSYYARSPEIFAVNNGMAQVMLCSAFVMESRGIWFLVTAGHVLDGMKEEREAGIEQVSFRLIDGFAHDAPDQKNHVPFVFDPAATYRLNAEGLDYGLIWLSPNAVANLQANKVVPISEDHYEKTWPDKFDGYAMIGTPGSTTHHKQVSERSTMLTHSLFSIVIEEETNPPEELIQPNDRFYGRIVIGDDAPGWLAIKGDIRGMSGGPIIGVKFEDGGTRYWVIGVQSGWLESKRVIAACWFQQFAKFVGEMLDAATPSISSTDFHSEAKQ